MDVDKLKTVPADLSKLSSVVDIHNAKKTVYDKLIIKFNAIDAKITITSGLVTKTHNLVPSASCRYKRVAKKRSWNTSNRWLTFFQIKTIFFKDKLRNTSMHYWKYHCYYSYKFGRFVRRIKYKNKIKTWAESNISISLYG